jgi:hypothetical protein
LASYALFPAISSRVWNGSGFRTIGCGGTSKRDAGTSSTNGVSLINDITPEARPEEMLVDESASPRASSIRHRAGPRVGRPPRRAPRLERDDRRINLHQGDGAMPLIKPRTRGKQLVKHRTRLDRENNETLYAYAHFLGESPEYVLNQLIDTVLARDKEFVQWRTTHQNSFVPGSRAHGRLNGNTRRAGHQVTSVSGEPATVAATR